MRGSAALAAILLFGLSACATPPQLTCEERADNVAYVSGQDTCLALSTHGAAQPGQAVSLVIVLDGRNLQTRGGFGAEASAMQFAADGVVSIAMAPPGLRLGGGARSDNVGSPNVPATPELVADTVADGIQNLRIHYAAGRVVLVSYGSGAAIAGVVMGRHPGLVTDAVLVRCPCGNPENGAVTPLSLANRVPPGTRVVLLGVDGAGSTTLPDIQGYVDRLTERGVEARVEPLDTGAAQASVQDAVAQAVEELLR